MCQKVTILEKIKNEDTPVDETWDKVRALCEEHGTLIYDWASEGDGLPVVEIALDEHISFELETALKQLAVTVVRI